MTDKKSDVTDGRTSVPGLYYHRQIVPVEAQEELIKFFESIPSWEKAGIAKRKVLHFGYVYPYNRALKLTPTHPIPEIIQRLLIQPLQSLPGINATEKTPWVPDQVIINRYLLKEGISAHTDHKKLFKDRIVCVTLGESADMLFKHVELPNATIRTDPGSVYVMTEKARWEYTHEMIPNKFGKPRYSITFRNIEPQYIIGTEVSAAPSAAPSTAVTAASAPPTAASSPSTAVTAASATPTSVSAAPTAASAAPTAASAASTAASATPTAASEAPTAALEPTTASLPSTPSTPVPMEKPSIKTVKLPIILPNRKPFRKYF
jgi:alkylated DNA repair dioxygenase AlkB